MWGSPSPSPHPAENHTALGTVGSEARELAPVQRQQFGKCTSSIHCVVLSVKWKCLSLMEKNWTLSKLMPRWDSRRNLEKKKKYIIITSPPPTHTHAYTHLHADIHACMHTHARTHTHTYTVQIHALLVVGLWKREVSLWRKIYIKISTLCTTACQDS